MDLNKTIKFSTTHHFDTNLLIVGESMKKLQKHVNLNLKFACKYAKSKQNLTKCQQN